MMKYILLIVFLCGQSFAQEKQPTLTTQRDSPERSTQNSNGQLPTYLGTLSATGARQLTKPGHIDPDVPHYRAISESSLRKKCTADLARQILGGEISQNPIHKHYLPRMIIKLLSGTMPAKGKIVSLSESERPTAYRLADLKMLHQVLCDQEELLNIRWETPQLTVPENISDLEQLFGPTLKSITYGGQGQIILYGRKKSAIRVMVTVSDGVIEELQLMSARYLSDIQRMIRSSSK